MGLNLGSFMVPPPSAIVGITSKRSAQSLNITSKKPNVKDLATYFSAQIGVAESLRKNAEKRWKEAIRAFNNEPITTPDDSWVFGVQTDQMVKSGLPYAASMTTVAALTARYPTFLTRPKKEKSRELAKLVRLILKNGWCTDERQWLMQKAVLMLRHTGLAIGRVFIETDFDEYEKEQDREEEKAAARAGLSTEESALEDTLDRLVSAEMEEVEDDSEPILTEAADHFISPDKPTVILDSPFEYVADPDCRTFTHGVRWEGIKKRARIIDLKMNPRYDKAALAKLKPNCQPSKEVLRANPAMPSDFQMVEYYEIYDYTDPEFRYEGGALMTIVRDQELMLERRANPYGARVFEVGEYNADACDPENEYSRYPQTDFDSWKEHWYAFQDILYRALRQIQKAPYSTLVLDKDAQISKDEIEAVLESSGPGIVAIPMDGKNIQQVMQELNTKQVSPEYINFLRFVLELIRLFEGLGPNQFGGAALKSETSATEAGEIGNFSRARLDVKEFALRRWMNGLAKKYVSAVFRFCDFDEIVEMVGEEVAKTSIDIDKARAGDIVDVSIEVEAGSMAPEGPAQKAQKLMMLMNILTLDPMLMQQLNRDNVTNLLNDIFSNLDTGEDMFVPLDSMQAQAGRMMQMLQQGGGGQPKGKPSPPKSQPVTDAA